MKKQVTLFSLAMALLVLGSCIKETIIKEEKAPDVSIYGLWKVSPGNTFNYKYLNFSTLKVASIYTENGGFKGIFRTTFIPYPDQVLGDLKGVGFPSVFNYKVSGDTLKIMEGTGLILTALKSTSTEINDWVTPVSITETIPNLYGTVQMIGGIGFDGNSLLVPEYNTSKIHRVSPVTKSIVSTLTTAIQYHNTVEFDGTDYWTPANGWDVVNKIKASDGSTLFTSTSIAAWMYGVASLSPTQLALFGEGDNKLHMYNPVTNTVAFSKSVNINFRDMAAYDSKLYVTAYDNKIYKMDPAGFVAEKTYELTGFTGYLTGIASVGGGVFWVFDLQTRRLLKVSLP